MGLFSRKKKELVYPDPRFLEKIEQSDLLEYREEQRKTGINVDMIMGRKVVFTDNPFMYFVWNLLSLNTSSTGRKLFEEYGFTESEINAIFGSSQIVSLSPPTRCIKDLVWHYMFQQEYARLDRANDNGKVAKDVDKMMELLKDTHEWLDWDKAIEEFWIDESEKDYKSYIIT
jgi:hypothetical protein